MFLFKSLDARAGLGIQEMPSKYLLNEESMLPWFLLGLEYIFASRGLQECSKDGQRPAREVAQLSNSPAPCPAVQLTSPLPCPLVGRTRHRICEIWGGASRGAQGWIIASGRGGRDHRQGQRNWHRASALYLVAESSFHLWLGEGPREPRERLLQGQEWSSISSQNQLWQIQAQSRHTLGPGFGASQGVANDLGQDSVWKGPRFHVWLELGISMRLGSSISRCSESGLSGDPGSRL